MDTAYIMAMKIAVFVLNSCHASLIKDQGSLVSSRLSHTNGRRKHKQSNRTTRRYRDIELETSRRHDRMPYLGSGAVLFKYSNDRGG